MCTLAVLSVMVLIDERRAIPPGVFALLTVLALLVDMVLCAVYGWTLEG